MRVACTLLLACIASLANAGAIARLTAALPDVEPPPHGEARWIARSMRMNGLPMTLKSFGSALDPDAVFSHYESWAKTNHGTESRRSRVGEWQVLSIKSPQHVITIQVHATVRGSEGTIAVSPLLENAITQVATSFPHPTSTKVVSLQEYDDDGVEAEHISLVSTRSVGIEAEAFLSALTRDGWQVVREHRMSNETRGQVIEAQLGAQQALLTLMPDHANPSITAVIVVWRKA